MKTLLHTASRHSLPGLFLLFGILSASAQDGIYDDIYQTPSYDAGNTGTSNPLDGYSTYDQDDYYQPQNTNNNTQGAPSTEQYVDEDGNTYITNNYYGDDDYDYFYASRINRFHRPIHGFGYYDPFYTNMYWYNYDPFFYGTSIYAGWGMGGFYNPWHRPWGWNSWGGGFGMGWNSWGGGFGMGWGYQPFCHGGWGMGMGGWGMDGYGMGYNQGYWNGYYDGMAMGGGYYNTFDQNSGIYYGHRGGSAGNAGSGLRSNSLGERYNRAAATGLVSHANRNNILQTADARPVAGRTNLDGYQAGNSTAVRKPSNESRPVEATPSRTPSPAVANPQRVPNTQSRDVIDQRGNNGKVPAQTGRTPQTAPQRNPQGTQTVPQRTPQQNTQSVPQRNPQGVQSAPQRNPQGTQTAPQRTPQRNPQAVPQRTPQNYGTRVPQAAPQRTQPNYQAPARAPQQPQRDVYQRGQRPNTTAPSYRSPSTPQQTRPSQQVPSRNYSTPRQQPSRDYTPSRQQPNMSPSRQAPSRDVAPSRNVSPQRSAPAPSRNYSPSPSPSRGGSFSSPSRGGGGSAPSRGGSSGGRRGG